ncbi:MAG TPA: Xaa-Pro peptidase family protein [Gaiellales bacterium]|nr:Xaa-Pro peptidase family protein [Gaiellales bacterium]
MIAAAPIAREEFAGRIARVRDRMADAGCDTLVCYGAHVDYAPGDLRYLADWFCIEEEQAILLVPADGPVVLVTDAAADLDRAREQAVCDEVALASDLGAAVADRLRGRPAVGLTGAQVVPAVLMDALCAAVPVSDASALTTELRMVKSPAELALLAEAARISDLGMAAGLDAVGEGAREIEVAAAAEHAIRLAGAELSFTTVAGAGPRTALGTFLPGDRPMRAGEAVVLDCGARVHGYHGDMCRTVAVGDPPPELEPALDAVAAAVEAAIDAARPGVTVGDLREAARGAVAEAGLAEAWWGEFMPHGAGTGQHEPPYGDRDPACELREGMVLCIEPGVLIPGVAGVVHEQMVAITDAGAEVLNRLPLRMWRP